MSEISTAGPGKWKRIPGQKKCTRCCVYKPGADFRQRKPNEAPGYRFQWCAACLLVPRRIETQEASGHTYKTKREVVQRAKDRPCTDCGNKFHFAAMEFDHVRGQKFFNLAAPAGWTYEEILEEIMKCDVVCANCHRVRTFSRPHKYKTNPETAPTSAEPAVVEPATASLAPAEPEALSQEYNVPHYR